MPSFHRNSDPPALHKPRPATRILLFTDTLGDVNGVSRFIRNIAEHALATARDLHVITSTNIPCPQAPNIHILRPLLAMKMPGYDHLELVLPPVLPMLALARRLRPDAVHVSTPGPVGAVGLLAARLLRVPLLGVYHTDFPAYIDRLFGNDVFTAGSRHVMRLFYRRFTTIFTRSRDYVESLRALGLTRAAIVPLLPGIMTQHFHPRFRCDTAWDDCPAPDRPVRILSVGRLSIEKNLPLLVNVWKSADAALKAQGTPAELIIVGDGPYRQEMELLLAGTRTRFLGFRHAEGLAKLYASSDLFIFPSLTDTLGQVVMEAQASGLPVLVSDQGGPKEVVRNGVTGFVLPAHHARAWLDRLVQLVTDISLRSRMGAAAHAHLQQFSLDHSFNAFWRAHEAALEKKSG